MTMNGSFCEQEYRANDLEVETTVNNKCISSNVRHTTGPIWYAANLTCSTTSVHSLYLYEEIRRTEFIQSEIRT